MFKAECFKRKSHQYQVPRVLLHPSSGALHCWTFVVPSQHFTDLFLIFLWAELCPPLVSCKDFCVSDWTWVCHLCREVTYATESAALHRHRGVREAWCDLLCLQNRPGELPALSSTDRSPTEGKHSDLGLCQDWHNSTVLMAGQDAKLHFISICLPLPLNKCFHGHQHYFNTVLQPECF